MNNISLPAENLLVTQEGVFQGVGYDLILHFMELISVLKLSE